MKCPICGSSDIIEENGVAWCREHKDFIFCPECDTHAEIIVHKTDTFYDIVVKTEIWKTLKCWCCKRDIG
jgi:hypothetical protein